MSGISLTAKETALIIAVVNNMNEIPGTNANWEVIAPQVGHKYARNARAAFKKLWSEKLGGSNGGTGGSSAAGASAGASADDDDDDDDGANGGGGAGASTPIKKKRTPAKKRVGGKTEPVKASPAKTVKGKGKGKKAVAQVTSDEEFEDPEHVEELRKMDMEGDDEADASNMSSSEQDDLTRTFKNLAPAPNAYLSPIEECND